MAFLYVGITLMNSAVFPIASIVAEAGGVQVGTRVAYCEERNWTENELPLGEEQGLNSGYMKSE
jgi:hypothetical protein